MDFDEALSRTVNLLERQGFATYRTLKRRFHLDDATLAALKTALVDTQHLAADEAGTRLVWLGELRPGSGPTRLEEDAAPGAVVPRLAPGHRAWTPLVGREAEVALLRTRWTPVLAGQGQVVILGGEVGIGKSRLVQVVKAQGAEWPHRCWEGRCEPAWQHSALAPIIDLVQRGLHLQPDAAPADKLLQLEAALAPGALPLAELVPLLASVLSVPLEARYTLPALPPVQQKQRLLEAIVTLLQAVAAQEPVLLIVEDLHWADASTLELLTLLVDRVAAMRCYLLLTHRPEFQAPWGPLAHSTVLTLGRLESAQVAALATQVAGGKALPAVVVEQILARTDGVPLFVEEVTQMVLESGLLAEREAAYVLTRPLPALTIPTTVQASVRARLASLGAAAVWGRAVTEAQLQATVGLERGRLERAVGRLVAADIVHELSLPPRLTYVFKHALIQDVAYATLPDDRRRTLHAQIAQWLVARQPETVATQPELLAQHYTAAGLPAQAIPYWLRAGQQARQRSANPEAIRHLTTGLVLVAMLLETPARAQQEFDLRIALGPALMATKGQSAPEVEQTYARAQELCRQVGETPELIRALGGLFWFYQSLGALPTARELGEQLYRLAQRTTDPTHLLEAHAALGTTLFLLGEYAAARTHLEQGIVRTDPAIQRSLVLSNDVAPGVQCLAVAANVLWCQGHPAQALRRSQEALTLAQALAHPQSLALAQHYTTLLHHRRREALMAQTQAEVLLTLATAQGFPLFVGFGTCWRGWALALQGQCMAGLSQVSQGLTAVMGTAQKLSQPLCLVLLAEVTGQAGQVVEGLYLLTEAIAAFEASGRGDLLVEAYRLQGTFLLRRTVPDAAQAEACFQQALTIARHQQAKSWELRAATSLSRLWQQQGKYTEAFELLAPIYDWFTEGFDTADLQEAKALLEALR